MSVAWFDWFTECDVYLHLQPVALPNFSWLCEVSFHNSMSNVFVMVLLKRTGFTRVVIESEVTLSGMENHCSLPICWTCPRSHLWVPGGLTSMGKSWRGGMATYSTCYTSRSCWLKIYRQKSAQMYDDACYVYPHMQNVAFLRSLWKRTLRFVWNTWSAWPSSTAAWNPVLKISLGQTAGLMVFWKPMNFRNPVTIWGPFSSSRTFVIYESYTKNQDVQLIHVPHLISSLGL